MKFDVDRALDRLRLLDRYIGEEQAIADILSTYADQHQRVVFQYEQERDVIRAEMEASA